MLSIGVVGDGEGKAQQAAFEIPVIFEAKAFVAGQLISGDGDEARARMHSSAVASFAHAQRRRD